MVPWVYSLLLAITEHGVLCQTKWKIKTIYNIIYLLFLSKRDVIESNHTNLRITNSSSHRTLNHHIRQNQIKSSHYHYIFLHSLYTITNQNSYTLDAERIIHFPTWVSSAKSKKNINETVYFYYIIIIISFIIHAFMYSYPHTYKCTLFYLRLL